jgi:hypothetical protein
MGSGALMGLLSAVLDAAPFLRRTSPIAGRSGALAQMVAEEIANQRGVPLHVAEDAVDSALGSSRMWVETQAQLLDLAAMAALSVGVAPPSLGSERAH